MSSAPANLRTVRFKSAALPVCGILLVYLLFLTKTYYWDGVLFAFYAEQARQGAMPFAALFHPNHLLYTPVAYGLCRLVWMVLPGVRSLAILQVLNSVLSAGCALLMFRLAARLFASQTLSVFALLLFAGGATWWKFSTDADPYIASVLLGLAAITFALDRNVTGVIVCLAGAMLFHELAVFLCVPVAFLLWKEGGLKTCLICLGTTAALVAGAYLAAYKSIDRGAGFTLVRWVVSYAGDTPVTHTFRQIFVGYIGSCLKLFAGGKLSLVRQFLGPVTICAVLVCAAAIVVAGRLWARPDEIRSEPPRNTALLWIWFVPMALFLAFFDPASTFHKLFLWPPLVLLLTSALPNRRAASFVVLAAALWAWNFGAFIWPHSHEAADPVLGFARRLDKELPVTSRIYYAAFSPDDWYLRYFGTAHAWDQLPVPPEMTEPVCLETTALNTMPQEWAKAKQKWALQTPQHNIRVACIARR